MLTAAGVGWDTFRAAAKDLGAYQKTPGLAFFDAGKQNQLAFGAGAGLALGISVGAENVRGVLVDANGWQYYPQESDRMSGQLAAEPSVIIGRIKEIASKVIDAALGETEFALVDGALPMLGCGVAWPTPIDRDYNPIGQSLAHNAWRSGKHLDQRVKDALGIDEFRSYSLNDARAAAIAIAHRETHEKDALSWKHSMVTMVLRLAGNLGGAVIVLEPPRMHRATGPRMPEFRTSGFLNSILIGGVDNLAGEIGHVPISPGVIATLNKNRPKNLGKLAAERCSCSSNGAKPVHLQAFASVLPVTKRVKPTEKRGIALDAIVARPDDEPQRRALEDAGLLVGGALVGIVRVLNPAKIVVTGSLALPVVCKQIKARIDEDNSLGRSPAVPTPALKEEDDYLRARGAALALIRNTVHRNLDELFDGSKDEVADRVSALTVKLSSNPMCTR